ncbi:MAG: RNA polymerase sigma-70 factor [Cytophagales bacterium]|nr:RNA polymerase sigma-70 factor [Cytophagales bacterium]
MGQNISEKYIIFQLRAKNKEVFKFLFESYFPELVFFAQKMLFDIMKSEDVVKDLFLHMWENAANLEIKISLKAYLYQAVKNRCLNQLKKIDIIGSCDLNALNNIIIDADTEDYDKEYLEQEILKAIKKLPPKMAVIIELKYFKGYKRYDIAEMLNISELTVKNHLAKGRQYLRKELKYLF